MRVTLGIILQPVLRMTVHCIQPARGTKPKPFSSPFFLLSTNSSCLIAPILQIHSRLVSLALCYTEPTLWPQPHRFLPSINSCSLSPSVFYTFNQSLWSVGIGCVFTGNYSWGTLWPSDSMFVYLGWLNVHTHCLSMWIVLNLIKVLCILKCPPLNQQGGSDQHSEHLSKCYWASSFCLAISELCTEEKSQGVHQDSDNRGSSCLFP